MHATLYLMHSVMGSQCSFCRRVAEWWWWDAMRTSLKADFWTFWRVDNRTGCIHETPLDTYLSLYPYNVSQLNTFHTPDPAVLSVHNRLSCPKGRAYSLPSTAQKGEHTHCPVPVACISVTGGPFFTRSGFSFSSNTSLTSSSIMSTASLRRAHSSGVSSTPGERYISSCSTEYTGVNTGTADQASSSRLLILKLFI